MLTCRFVTGFKRYLWHWAVHEVTTRLNMKGKSNGSKELRKLYRGLRRLDILQTIWFQRSFNNLNRLITWHSCVCVCFVKTSHVTLWGGAPPPADTSFQWFQAGSVWEFTAHVRSLGCSHTDIHQLNPHVPTECHECDDKAQRCFKCRELVTSTVCLTRTGRSSPLPLPVLRFTEYVHDWH